MSQSRPRSGPFASTPGPIARTPRERAEVGRSERSRVPRSALGALDVRAGRHDPLEILRSQEVARVPDLVPIRHERMTASSFAFFRGAAAVMAADLAAGVSSGLEVQLCGDAHLSNFGGFASPERSLVFDLNDFDETLPGPFEWDVKRLVASMDISARSLGIAKAKRRQITTAAAAAYRDAIRRFGSMSNLDVWYSQTGSKDVTKGWKAELPAAALQRLGRGVAKAESKDRLKAKKKLTTLIDGELRFVSDPPLLVPASELFSDHSRAEAIAGVTSAFEVYLESLDDHLRHLIDGYRFADLARKVVGVGSVGTRCWIVLLVGRDTSDPLFIQVKEAEASVLEPYLGSSRYANHGERVVQGQRLTQAASDILLGWSRVEPAGSIDGRTHDYYMRTLWDWKASADVDQMEPDTLEIYGEVCGRALARAHARSGDAIAIGAYLGKGTSFDLAMSAFAEAYADLNVTDHRRLVEAVADGAVQVSPEI